MKRRDFITLIGTGFICPSLVLAQGSKKRASLPESTIPRIGVLWHAANEREEARYLAALLQGFKALGYVEGKTFVLENRFAAEHYERFGVLAAELVAAKVDVLVAVTPFAAVAAQRATAKIPVVFVAVPDPVGFKLADSLARPGRNLTGLANFLIDLSGKRVELLKTAIPSLSRVILLLNTKNPNAKRYVAQHHAAAVALGLEVQNIRISDPINIESAFSAITDRNTGLIIEPDSILYNERKLIAELAIRHGLPSMSFNFEMAEAGFLLSYGDSFVLQFRQVAAYVDKILKGANPADLPIERPIEFELVINLKTAKALGLTVPPLLLARADKVIE
jgi:putative ABC transport system substrate-binding protein